MAKLERKPEFERFAARIRRAREACALTQEEVGARLGRVRAWVNHLERGRAVPPDHETAENLANLLKLDPGELWDEIVPLKTDKKEREVWQRRIEAASLTGEGLSDAERVLLATLRNLGRQLGDPDALARMLGDLLRGWEWADSAVMRSFEAPGGTHVPAPARVAGVLATLDLVRRMDPGARAGFVEALQKLAAAFGVAQVHANPEFRDGATDGREWGARLLTPRRPGGDPSSR